jgi:hypothetical protein
MNGSPEAPTVSTTVADVIVPKGNFGPTDVSGQKKKRKAASAYGQQISDEHAAMVLGQGHPKSQRTKASWRK